MASASTASPLDETCPLLESQVLAKPAPTPIPKGQLAALCTVRIVEPIAFTQLFPYVNEFMSDLHLTDDPSRVGFYSGLVVRCISICASDASSSPYSGKCLCSRSTHLHIPLGSSFWSVYSQPALRALTFLLDVIGRRPVILLGFLGITATTLMFGLSKSLAAVLITRCIGQSQVFFPLYLLTHFSAGGFSSGNVAVVHSVLGEITDATNQATVFPIYGLIYPLGAIVGLVHSSRTSK